MSSKILSDSLMRDSAVAEGLGIESVTETQANTPETSVNDGLITLTDVLTVISNQRRRFVLHYLQRSGPAATTGELSTQIAAWELGQPAERVSSTERKNVYNALAQTHIRCLCEHGFINEQRGVIELTEEAQSIRIHLDLVPHKDVHWSHLYLGIGAFGLVTSALFGVFSSGAVPAGGWGVFISVLILVTAAAHRYYKQRLQIGGGELPPEIR